MTITDDALVVAGAAGDGIVVNLLPGRQTCNHLRERTSKPRPAQPELPLPGRPPSGLHSPSTAIAATVWLRERSSLSAP
ncbi:MAG: hypothetical protein ACRC7O_13925, partial [Fimbriiglobus sp.]